MERTGGSDDAGDDFASTLSRALDVAGTTLAHLRRRLDELGTPVSVTTLSYWRSGRRRPSGPDSARVVANVERVLGVEPGRLAGAVEHRTPRRSRPEAAADDPTLAIRRRLDGLGDPGLSDDSVQHVLDVDADGCPGLLRVRCLHRATRDGVDRRVLTVTKRSPDGAARPFTALAGGRIGRTAEDADSGVYGAEFVFDKPLRSGDTVVIEYQVELGVSDETFYEVAVLRRLRHAMVWVRFAPEQVPQRVEIYRDSRRGGRIVRTVDMARTTSVHHAVSGGASTRIGVRWHWDLGPGAGS